MMIGQRTPRHHEAWKDVRDLYAKDELSSEQERPFAANEIKVDFLLAPATDTQRAEVAEVGSLEHEGLFYKHSTCPTEGCELQLTIRGPRSKLPSQ